MTDFINLENVNILEALYNFAMALITALPLMAGWIKLILKLFGIDLDAFKEI